MAADDKRPQAKPPERRIFTAPSPSLLDRADPHLLAVRAISQALKGEDEESSRDIGVARLKLYDAIKAGNKETCDAWMNALEAAILVVPKHHMGHLPLNRAVMALRALVDSMDRP